MTQALHDRPVHAVRLTELDADLVELFNAGARVEALLMQILRMLGQRLAAATREPTSDVNVHLTTNSQGASP